MMSAMLTSRVELMQALELAQKSVKISRRRSKLETVNQDVRGGISLAEALEKQAALTPTGYNLIRVGEQTGELAPVLRSLSKLYDESSRTRMKQVLTLIEPLAILLIGAVIGVIILGIILAITSVNDVGL
jgi:general secretion pathway protein F